jgi:[ribosomal protein S5]-alanine N-acetyltransferase
MTDNSDQTVRIDTNRLTLRHWRKGNEADEQALFKYASDPDIGIRCGWMPHQSIEMSMEAIEEVFTGDENYAITLRGEDVPIGCIELKRSDGSPSAQYVREAINEGRLLPEVDIAAMERTLAEYSGDRDLGYWIGRPFWGQGLMTEALGAMLTRAFEVLGTHTVWGGHYVENPASGKVMRHCGMRPVCRKDDAYFPLIDRHYDCMILAISKNEWERRAQRSSL